jgi:hypothetical protein
MKAGWVYLLPFCASTHAADPLDQWQIIARPPTQIRSLAHKEGRFVGVSYGTNMVVSTNAGVHWSLLPINLRYFIGARAVTAGAGQFVAVGWNGNILTSSDGLQWTRRRGDSPSDEEWWSVIYAGGRFVAVGFSYDMTIAATSTDGTEWDNVALAPWTSPRNIAYGNGMYVAAAPEALMSSTNGRDWSFVNAVRMGAIAYGGGQFVAVIRSGAGGGYRSSNGMDWTEITLPMLRHDTGILNLWYSTAVYGNGLFVIVGYCQDCPNEDRPGVVATSSDGIEWTSRLIRTDGGVGQILGSLFVNGAFYLADQWGRIWKSGRMAPSAQPGITQVTRSDGQTSLSFTTIAGFNYRLECADNLTLAPWMPCAQRFATDSQLTIVDTNATPHMRFYRVRVE